jgi:hypothetical protein
MDVYFPTVDGEEFLSLALAWEVKTGHGVSAASWSMIVAQSQESITTLWAGFGPRWMQYLQTTFCKYGALQD